MDDLIRKLDYIDDLSLIKKAYIISSSLHEGQFRDSGEDYITHPISVAKILASMHGDLEVICAALLHDTIEDTLYTKDDIECEFGKNIAFLVDGVSKEGEKNFSSSLERNIFNNNKLVLCSLKDMRVMIIKLADRLHNMSTLEFKSYDSIISNSKETMNFYVPVSSLLGMGRFKRILEDFSFKYLDEELYDKTLAIRKRILNYSSINLLKKGVFNYLKYMGIDGKAFAVYDGILESYYKIRNGIDVLFTIYVIGDIKYNLPFKEDIIKSVSFDEFNFLENGIASNFENINLMCEEMGLYDELLLINNNYCKGLVNGGIR